MAPYNVGPLKQSLNSPHRKHGERQTTVEFINNRLDEPRRSI